MEKRECKKCSRGIVSDYDVCMICSRRTFNRVMEPDKGFIRRKRFRRKKGELVGAHRDYLKQEVAQ